MDAEIVRFFDERKEAWLKKNLKAGMDDNEVREKELECEVQFSLNEWLPNAAKRAGQISISTHPCTFSHPSSRKNKNGYATSIIAKMEACNDGYLRSGNVEVAADALGNAAALDVYKFLTLEMTDGQTLLQHIEADSDLAKALLSIKEQSYEELKQGFLAMTQSDAGNVTSAKIKQVYFPVAGGYHQLSILTPSGIVFELRKRLDTLRFGEVVDDVNLLKVARERRKNNEHHNSGYSEIYGLTTIGYGGTKPQNISVLNNQNGGKAHLLLSAPPALVTRDIQLPNSDFFAQSVSYFQCKDLFYKLHELYKKDDNNMHVRAARDEYYQGVVDRIIDKMWQIRLVSQSQYNPEYNQLKHEQKVWLIEQGQYIESRISENEWLERITIAITQFIFHGYEKILAKKAIKLGDGEHERMARIVKKNQEALR